MRRAEPEVQEIRSRPVKAAEQYDWPVTLGRRGKAEELKELKELKEDGSSSMAGLGPDTP